MKIYKLNIANFGDVAKKYNIAGVPALLYIKSSNVVDKKFGIQSVEQLKKLEIKNF